MNITQLIEKIKTDAEFALKYIALKDVVSIIEQAKEDGYDVTEEDVAAAMREMLKKSGELSEADLAVVAGGNKTVNRHNAECATRTKVEKTTCNGWQDNTNNTPPCDHYRRNSGTIGIKYYFEHKCVKGQYHYYSSDYDGQVTITKPEGVNPTL